MAAFQDDLQLLGYDQRVITMTFSEFGRRIRSNDSLGTDHGTAAPILVFGGCVNAGITGSTPELPDQPGPGDGVPMQFDFRNVYGTLFSDWFGVEEEEIRSLLYEDYTRIPFIQVCDLSTPTDDLPGIDQIPSTAFPNPFRGNFRLRFQSSGEEMRISIFDSMGHEVMVIANRFIPSGNQEIIIETGDLPPGNYFYRLRSTRGITTRSIVKI